MIYIAKLAKRLAMSRQASALISVAVLAACSADSSLAPHAEQVQNIVMDADSVRLVAGARISLTAEVLTSRGRATDQQLQWRSSDPSVATVDSTGLVTSYSLGTTEIRATKRGKTGKTIVTVVNVPVAKIMVTPSISSLVVGDTIQLEAITLSATDSLLTGRTIVWSTDAPTVLTISERGVLVAVDSGTARITATSEGVVASTSISVAAAESQSTPTANPGIPFFADNFDLGTRTSANGFSWGSAGSRVTVSNERAFSGSHSLRFRFGPEGQGLDSSAEQRFTLGTNLAEVWFEYMLFVPANYFHRQDSPSNNKFFRLWGDSYSAANKVGASSFPEASGSSHLAFEYNYEGWSDGTLGTGPSSVAGAKSTTTAFGTDATRGRWIQVRIHARHVSGPSARDGRLRMWVNGQLVISFENVPQKFDSARPYWNAGYLFGWANSGFSEETLFFVDDVRFFASSPGW